MSNAPLLDFFLDDFPLGDFPLDAGPDWARRENRPFLPRTISPLFSIPMSWARSAAR